MRTLSRWGPLLLAAGVLAAAGAGRAADDKAAGPMDRKALDVTLYNNLRDVINRGAALYNSGDQAGCYRLYEGALMAVRPLLDHRKKLQDDITTSLTQAEQDPMLNRRAFLLRSALDKVRDEVNPKGTTAGGALSPGTGTGTGARVKPKARTAWDRMGGERGVKKVVDDLADTVTKDPKVDFFRDGKVKPTDAEVARMKRMIVEQISSVTGGPLAYEGKSMVEIHKDMGITNAQFDAFVADFKEVLRKNSVDARDADDLLGKVEATRKEIVRPKPAPGAGDKTPKPAAGGAQVNGKITLDGKPLPGGEVVLHDTAGKTTKGTVKADGSYEIKNVKPGTYTVTMKTDDKDVKVPKQYTDPKTSPLVAVIKEGEQTRDYALMK
jgi:truncated hemoglobin YjbI